MPDREKVIERLQRVSRYFKSMLKVGYDGDAEIYREHRESVKMAIELLKEQEDLGAELTNAVELIHKKNERIEKLLKEQEAHEQAICKEICDFIRHACSTDTDDDKDYVCYVIQKCFTHFCADGERKSADEKLMEEMDADPLG